MIEILVTYWIEKKSSNSISKQRKNVFCKLLRLKMVCHCFLFRYRTSERPFPSSFSWMTFLSENMTNWLNSINRAYLARLDLQRGGECAWHQISLNCFSVLFSLLFFIPSLNPIKLKILSNYRTFFKFKFERPVIRKILV